MTDPTTPPKSSSRSGSSKTLGCLLIFFGIPILLCTGVATWVFGRQTIAKMEYREQVLQLRKRGMPVDGESLKQFRAERSDGTLAERWMKLLDELESEPYRSTTKGVPLVGVVSSPTVEPPAPNETWQYKAAVEKFLATNAERIGELHSVIIGTGPIRTDIDYRSFGTLVPYAQATRSASRLMTIEHWYAVNQGDRERCFQSVMANLGIARSLDAEPLIICQMIRAATASMAIACVQQSVEHDLLDDQQLREIDQQLAVLDDHASPFQMGLWGERALVMQSMDQPSPTSPNLNPMGLGYTGLVETLKWFQEIEDIATSGREAGQFLDSVQALQTKFQSRTQGSSPLAVWDNSLVQLTFPATQAHAESSVRTAMLSRLARTGIRVRMYQHQNGQWPGTLKDLDSVDIEKADLVPVGGKPFGYRINGDQVLLWGSVAKSSNDQTPDQPLTAEMVSEQGLGTWYWNLESSELR